MRKFGFLFPSLLLTMTNIATGQPPTRYGGIEAASCADPMPEQSQPIAAIFDVTTIIGRGLLTTDNRQIIELTRLLNERASPLIKVVCRNMDRLIPLVPERDSYTPAQVIIQLRDFFHHSLQ